MPEADRPPASRTGAQAPGRIPIASTGDPMLLVGRKVAAEMLSISERFLFTLTRDREVAHVRLRGRVLYSPAELAQWVEQRMQEARNNG